MVFLFGQYFETTLVFFLIGKMFIVENDQKLNKESGHLVTLVVLFEQHRSPISP